LGGGQGVSVVDVDAAVKVPGAPVCGLSVVTCLAGGVAGVASAHWVFLLPLPGILAVIRVDPPVFLLLSG
jgi:hypothetical protein